MGYDSEVRIKTAVDNSGLSKGFAMSAKEIDRLTANFNKQTESIKKQSAAIDDMRRKLAAIETGEKAPASLTAMEAQLKRITSEIKAQETAQAQLVQQYEQAQTAQQAATAMGRPEALERATAEVARLDNELMESGTRLDELWGKSDALASKIQEIKLDPSSSSEAQALRDKLAMAEGTLDSTKTKANELADALRDAFAADPTPVRDKVRQTGNNANRAATAVKRLGKETRNAGTHASKAAVGFGLMSGKLMSLIKAAFVFNVVRKALSELQKYMGALLQSNKQFMASWNAVKVNLLTAFAPIWEVIQPALVSFMNVLAKATQILATFVAMLFGKTYQQARASAEAMNEQADAIESVGGAAKKASKELFAFDEINQQVQEDSGGGGGGGNGLDFGAEEFELPEWLKKGMEDFLKWLEPLFEAVKRAWEALWESLKDAWDRWKDAIIEAWKRMWTTIRDFTILVLDTLTRVFQSQEWASFLDAVAKVLLLIMDIINDIVKAAHKAWEGDDRGYSFLQSFVYKWTEILELIHSVGRAFLAAWDEKGVSIIANILEIWTGINNIIGTLARKLREAWEANGNGIAIWNTILGIIDDVLGSLNRMNEAHLNWMQELDLEPLMSAFRRLLEAIRTVVDIIMGGLEWAYTNILLPLAKWVIEEAAPRSLDALATAADAAGKAMEILLGFAKDLYENFIKPIAETYGKEFLAFWDSMTPKIQAVIDTITQSEVWQDMSTILNAIYSVLAPVIGFLIQIAKWVYEFKVSQEIEAFASVFRVIAEVIGIVADLITGDFDGALQHLKNIWDMIVKYFEDSWNNIRNLAGSAWDFISGIWGAVAKWFDDNVIKPVAKFFADLWNGIWEVARVPIALILTLFDWLWTEIKKGAEPIVKWIDDKVIQPINKFFKGLKDTVSALFKSLWSDIQSVWNTVSGWFNTNVIQPVTGFFKDIWTDVSGFFTSLWNDVKSVWEGVAQWFDNNVTQPIANFFKGAINAIIDVINGMIGGLNRIKIDIPDWVSELLGMSKGTSFGFNIPTIPRLATGGVVGHGIYELGENGAEAVVPLENNTGWINAVAAQMADEFSNFSINPKVMNQLAERGARQGPSELSDSSIARMANAVLEGFASIMTSLTTASGNEPNEHSAKVYLDGREVGTMLYDILEREQRLRGAW